MKSLFPEFNDNLQNYFKPFIRVRRTTKSKKCKSVINANISAERNTENQAKGNKEKI